MKKYDWFTINGMEKGEYHECIVMEVVLPLNTPVRTTQLNYARDFLSVPKVIGQIFKGFGSIHKRNVIHGGQGP